MHTIVEGIAAWLVLGVAVATGCSLLWRRSKRVVSADPDVRAARGDLAEYMDTAKAFGNLDETPEFIAANQAVIDAEDRAKARRR